MPYATSWDGDYPTLPSLLDKFKHEDSKLSLRRHAKTKTSILGINAYQNCEMTSTVNLLPL